MNNQEHITELTNQQKILLSVMIELSKESTKIQQPNIVKAYAKQRKMKVTPNVKKNMSELLQKLQRKGLIQKLGISPSPVGMISINVWSVKQNE